MNWKNIAVTVLVTAIAKQPINAQADADYQREIKQWDINRVKSLTAENGWINLAGLFWLKQGRNSFGSAQDNDFVFPEGTIDKQAGYFELSGTTVKLFTTSASAIKVNDTLMKEAIIFNASQEKPAIVSHGDLRWTIIKRDDKIGLRLRNLKSPLLKEFKGISRFAVDPKWRIPATLETGSQPGHILITNVLGQTTPQKSPGKVSFSIDGKPYTLDALEDDGKLFIIFADASSGETTYPSGRFLTATMPGADGKIILDFNKAYNPPCAFTKFATCPLPPRQNRLPITIDAGEKYEQH